MKKTIALNQSNHSFSNAQSNTNSLLKKIIERLSPQKTKPSERDLDTLLKDFLKIPTKNRTVEYYDILTKIITSQIPLPETNLKFLLVYFLSCIEHYDSLSKPTESKSSSQQTTPQLLQESLNTLLISQIINVAYEVRENEVKIEKNYKSILDELKLELTGKTILNLFSGKCYELPVFMEAGADRITLVDNLNFPHSQMTEYLEEKYPSATLRIVEADLKDEACWQTLESSDLLVINHPPPESYVKPLWHRVSKKIKKGGTLVVTYPHTIDQESFDSIITQESLTKKTSFTAIEPGVLNEFLWLKKCTTLLESVIAELDHLSTLLDRKPMYKKHLAIAIAKLVDEIEKCHQSLFPTPHQNQLQDTKKNSRPNDYRHQLDRLKDVHLEIARLLRSVNPDDLDYPVHTFVSVFETKHAPSSVPIQCIPRATLKF